MKKYALIIFILLTIVSAYTCDMAAAISFDTSGYFTCDYPEDYKHYCVQLNQQLNSVGHSDGRGMILYNDTPADGIYDYRTTIPLDDIDYSDYYDDLSSSNAMLSHSRDLNITVDFGSYHPLVWESRLGDEIYTFMSDSTLEEEDLIDLLTEGADEDWYYDAIEHLHSNDHNASISQYSDACIGELYFLWLIKNIEANRDIIEGLRQALYKMNDSSSIGSSVWKNFILSTGDALYIYKNGTGYYHDLYWGEVVRVSGGNDYDQNAFAVSSIGEDINVGTATNYADLDNSLLNYELVVLHSDGDTDSYTNFGNHFTIYVPEEQFSMSNGVNWKCFPVDYTDLYAQDQLEETEDYTPILYAYNQSGRDWDDMEDYDLEYTKGYKISISGYNNPFVPLPYNLEGVHVLEDQEIPLSSTENNFWIPYFIKETMSPYDAFEDIIDSAVKIQAQYWVMSRKNVLSPWQVAMYPGSNGLYCYYGKMYEVTLVSGHPTVMDYYGSLDYGDMLTYTPPATEYFTYSEGLDYEAILIDTIVCNEPIEEVAIFENGECIGASVFESYPVFIRAFTSELNRSPEPLEFRIYTGGRSEPEVEYRVYDEDFAVYRDEDVYPRENVITRICLGEPGEAMPVMDDIKVHIKQYPDPFNPETAIEYSIPETGKVSITIYNIKGQKVKELVDAENSAGLHKVIWNGHDDKGRKAATGLYFYELRYKDQSVREKMLMIK